MDTFATLLCFLPTVVMSAAVVRCVWSGSYDMGLAFGLVTLLTLVVSVFLYWLS